MSSNYITPNLALFQTLDEFINPDKKKIPVNWSFTRKQNTDIP
ncbi:MAG: hypothetical protein JWQ14_1124, partial [Adhaeribacter sp.]|nr:hypothetical protein [Adhaeribacter sp.]